MVVPVETASPKHEYAARTLRPKSTGCSRLPRAARAPRGAPPRRCARAREQSRPRGRAAARRQPADGSERPASAPLHGRDAAGGGPACGLPGGRLRRLRHGPRQAGGGRRLAHEPVPAFRADLAGGDRAGGPGAPSGDRADRAAYIEELVVRRELAINHVYYEPRYDDYAGVPGLGAQDAGRASRGRAAAPVHAPSSSRPGRRTTATGTPP